MGKFCYVYFTIKKKNSRTSLVVQWIGIHLPVQSTRVQSPVQEDPPEMPQSNLARVPQLLLSLCSRAWKPQLPSRCAASTEASAP